jgi:uncharacterized phosphosugar-binding protein
MVFETYPERVRALLDQLQSTQTEAIDAAADLVVAAMQGGGTINVSEVGHGIHWDFINRAGGLVAVNHFSYTMRVNNPLPKCRADDQADPDAELQTIRRAVAASSLRAGDVMLVASVSGRNRGPIELALACREIGVKVIGFTALTYTAEVVSLHPSGMRLFEAVDVVVDNCAPYGDAAVDVEGYDCKLIPVSGVGMAMAGWLLWGRVMEKMAAAGDQASILISHNSKGGPEQNEGARERWHRKGY